MQCLHRLLNYILLEAHGYRCAVILNEFGESAGIEKALLNDSKVIVLRCPGPFVVPQEGRSPQAPLSIQSIMSLAGVTFPFIRGMALALRLSLPLQQENETFQLQDWVQLSNGCACCSVKNDFVKALESLMSKEGMYDYILIETTGGLHRNSVHSSSSLSGQNACHKQVSVSCF